MTTTPQILLDYKKQLTRGLRQSLVGTSLLYQIMRYHVGLEDEQGKPAQSTGKMLRPSLVLFTAREFGADLETALPAAVAIELIHNFSLIHDDIQDKDYTRRGRPAVWTKWGVEQAINAGDLMYSVAISQALGAGNKQAQALVAATCQMIEGQGLDLQFERKPVNVDSYLEMISKKTGALICCSFELGAISANQSPDTTAKLVQLGHYLGLAFQIQDDMLGIWEDGELTGKPQGSDIRSKKKSFPVVVGMDRATTSQRHLLLDMYSKETIAEEDITKIALLLEEIGARKAGEEKVTQELDKARSLVTGLPFSKEGTEKFNQLISFLDRRER